jgi:D-alanine-D-alanine ligase
MRKVAVFFGGKSCENEISILTGVFILNVLDRERFSPIPIYIHTDGGMYTSPSMTNLDVFKEKKFSHFEKIFFAFEFVFIVVQTNRTSKFYLWDRH